MARVRLIHWHAAEAEARAALLQAAGYDVAWQPPQGPALLLELKQGVPDAVIIDLSRLPSQGRDVALSLRSRAAARRVPLIFVGGAEEKAAAVRSLLPDAAYTTWEGILPVLSAAISAPPAAPAKPLSLFAGYSGKPLSVKLGIKPNMVVGLIGAPQGFADLLGELPAGARLVEGMSSDCRLLLWFVRARRELEQDLATMAGSLQQSSLWIIWPKKASGVQSDVSEPVVRATGLAAGLVDFKIAAIDATWSGLLFRRRKQAA